MFNKHNYRVAHLIYCFLIYEEWWNIGESRKNMILLMYINKKMADFAMIPKSAEEWLNCWKNVKEWEAMLKLGVENEIDSRFLNARLKTIFKNPSFFFVERRQQQEQQLLKKIRSCSNLWPSLIVQFIILQWPIKDGVRFPMVGRVSSSSH